jgi:hypothetical protein
MCHELEAAIATQHGELSAAQQQALKAIATLEVERSHRVAVAEDGQGNMHHRVGSWRRGRIIDRLYIDSLTSCSVTVMHELVC